MKFKFSARIAFAVLICFAFYTPLFASDPLVVRNVNVIDVTGGPLKKNMNVWIQADRIVSVEPFSPALPPKAEVVDGTGKYLIPGLWDMHVHWYEKEYFPLFIANGVTGVRQMSGTKDLVRWRNHDSRDELIPRQYVASPIMDGPDPYWPDSSWVVRNQKDADKAVKEAHDRTYDFVKVYNGLPRDAYFEIARKSLDLHFSFAGHLPFSMTAMEASGVGQKSIEHLFGLLDACSPLEMDLKKERSRIQTIIVRNGKREGIMLEWMRINEKAMDTFDQERATKLFEAFARYGTYQCPTLVINHANAFFGLKDFRNDPRLHFLPHDLLQTWEDRVFSRTEFSMPEVEEVGQTTYEKEVSLIPMMLHAGVQFLAGTDARNPFSFPGFSLPDELSLLVQAGLSPLQALQSATITPARFMGKENSFGTIEKGKFADLVLLDDNPLQNISNTTHIAAVIFKGKAYRKSDLEKMLARLKRK